MILPLAMCAKGQALLESLLVIALLSVSFSLCLTGLLRPAKRYACLKDCIQTFHYAVFFTAEPQKEYSTRCICGEWNIVLSLPPCEKYDHTPRHK